VGETVPIPHLGNLGEKTLNNLNSNDFETKCFKGTPHPNITSTYSAYNVMENLKKQIFPADLLFVIRCSEKGNFKNID
jgi:hypothetical protein